jgi:hypothetical protein
MGEALGVDSSDSIGIASPFPQAVGATTTSGKFDTGVDEKTDKTGFLGKEARAARRG